MKKIYTAIDIGSDTIKFVVGEYFKNKLNILATYEQKAKGIRKGLIVDPNLAINSIKDGIKEINNNLGIDIKKVIVGVPSYNAKFMFVTSEIEITGDAITTDDVNNLIKASVYSKVEQDYELITVLPLTFLIDGEKETKVVGKTGNKLEIKGIMISAPKKNVYSVLSVMEGAGLEVVDITVSALGDYYEVRNDNLDKNIGAIINLGHETTNVSVFSRGKLMNTETIQLGGINVDKDLAYMFNINVFDAREIKEKFASSHKRFIALNDVYEVKNTAGEVIKLNQIEVTEIVMDRLAELLRLAQKQILLLTKQNISYIVITGGLTEIRAFKNLVYEILGKDVIIYTEDTLGARNNKYTTSIGMIKYFIDKMEVRGKEYSMIDEQDEELLINPNNKNSKGKASITKIFGNFIGTKED
ncbi:MAG: cell division protein FtsA [Bacilli bacterium]|nr:cell division protein FtsA [Bacilli bacterium]